MKITSITAQQKDKNRVNVMVDGAYRFSLDISQYADLGIRVGAEYTEEELDSLINESQFGKLYVRTLEYCLMRPHSIREVKDYLYRKTRTTKIKTRSGDIKDREGVPVEMTERVLERLIAKGYVDDDKFAQYWVENRSMRKGISKRKLQAELRAKGVDSQFIEKALAVTERTDDSEIDKIIIKKRPRYADDQKLMQYLARQGFSYDDIKSAIDRVEAS